MFAKSSHKPYIFGTDEFLYTFGPEIFGGKDSLRMFSRSSVVHWLTQDKAEGDKEELCRRHGFGNLTLIDRPSNSSLGKQGVPDKSDEVMKSV